MKLTIQIAGMHCEQCVRAIRTAMESLPGVSACTVEIGGVEVAYDEAELETFHLIAAIRQAGDYEVVGFTRTD